MWLWVTIAILALIVIVIGFIVVLALRFADKAGEREVEASSSQHPGAWVRASVTPACRSCMAPGLYKAEERIREGWPACYDPDRAGQPVGAVCPQCGARRPADIDRGHIGALAPGWFFGRLN